MFTVGITTFEYRFTRHFCPLLSSIRSHNADVNIVVAVNGEKGQAFSEDYRRDMLLFLAQYRNVYPVFFPCQRGLATMWNRIISHAPDDRILLCNDDIRITDLSDFAQKAGNTCAVVNDSYSHFLVTKQEIDELGWFDERLLGYGEEDGDFQWRYAKHFGRPISRLYVSGIENCTEQEKDYRPVNIRCQEGMRYSQFNRDFVYGQKYRAGGDIKEMFDYSMEQVLPCVNQYPYERFYWENKGNV